LFIIEAPPTRRVFLSQLENESWKENVNPVINISDEKVVKEAERAPVKEVVISNDAEVMIVEEIVMERSSPSTTNQALILENIELKTKNQELVNQLKSCEQRLALLEGHVNRLNNLN